MDPSHLRTSTTRPEPVSEPAEAGTFPNPDLPTRRCRHANTAVALSGNPDPCDDGLRHRDRPPGRTVMLRLHAPVHIDASFIRPMTVLLPRCVTSFVRPEGRLPSVLLRLVRAADGCSPSTVRHFVPPTRRPASLRAAPLVESGRWLSSFHGASLRSFDPKADFPQCCSAS
jgi:hypothetical protein